MALDRVEQVVDQRHRQQRRLPAQIHERRVLGVVVVVLGLDARVLDLLDRRLTRELLGDRLGDLADRQVLGELVEHAELAPVGGILRGEANTFDRVHEVDQTARLRAVAVDGQRVAGAAWITIRLSTVPNTPS